MATKKAKVKPVMDKAAKAEDVVTPVAKKATAGWLGEVGTEEQLDPQEEKVLDIILKAVVGFILAWLGLSILLVIGGFFHLWK